MVHVIDALDDARDVTLSVLLPVSWRAWLRLAVVTFFVSGVGGGGSVGQGVQGIVSSPRPPGATLGRLGRVDLPTLPAVAPERLTLLLLVGGALVGALAVGYALVAAAMEFVLVDGLRTRRFALRRATRRFLGPGVRLFVFRTGVVVVLALGAALPLLVVFGFLPASVPGILLVSLVVVLVWVAGVVCLRLTTDFVVPTMLAEGRTVLSAWRRLLPLARTAWRAFALYLVIRLGLGVAAALLVGLVVGLAALVIVIPFALLGSLVVATVGLQGSGAVAVAVLVAGYVPLVVAAAVVVQVPVVVYLRCYALVLLGRLDARLALVSTETPESPGERTR